MLIMSVTYILLVLRTTVIQRFFKALYSTRTNTTHCESRYFLNTNTVL